MRLGPRRIVIGSAVLAAALAVDAVVLAIKWPFTRNSVVKSLSEEANGEVTVRKFHPTFFPAPGCILEGVVVHDGSGTEAAPLTACSDYFVGAG
jgi:predicted dinucleotide-binding enzyme